MIRFGYHRRFVFKANYIFTFFQKVLSRNGISLSPQSLSFLILHPDGIFLRNG